MTLGEVFTLILVAWLTLIGLGIWRGINRTVDRASEMPDEQHLTSITERETP